MDQPPQGQRFSHVYLDRGMPTQDSPRMRRRLAALVQNIPDCDLLAPLIEQEHGIDVPWLGSRRHWERFLALCDLRDVLDLVTTAYGYIAGKQRAGVYTAKAPMAWLQGVERIFAEENVQYAVDGKGGVHFSVDKEFAHNQATTIKALQSVRYANALHALEDGMADLRKVPPNGKGAIRGVFGAAEAVFKLILPKVPRLGADELDGLTPVLQRHYERDDVARRSSAKMLNSLKDWVDAAHFYRHEAGKPDQVAQPPLDFNSPYRQRRDSASSMARGA